MTANQKRKLQILAKNYKISYYGSTGGEVRTLDSLCRNGLAVFDDSAFEWRITDYGKRIAQEIKGVA